mmetsp:Transcript_10397/g.30735  ORF Transcript_10397/g.30735 Transcript_10397/m.30735 type:complete len:265 (-) Transcript_10397:682-1476(-)
MFINLFAAASRAAGRLSWCARGRSSGRPCAAAADGCRSRSRTTARQNGHGASFRGGLVARTCVMHWRQKLWLHGVVTRSLYGSKQMPHSPSDCGRAPVGWGGVAWSVRELAGGCARTVGGGATSTGDAVSAPSGSPRRIRARCSAHQGAGRAAAAGDDAAAGGAGLGAAAVSPPPVHPKQIALSKKVPIIGPRRVLRSNHVKIMATFAVAKRIAETFRTLSGMHGVWHTIVRRSTNCRTPGAAPSSVAEASQQQGVFGRTPSTL